MDHSRNMLNILHLSRREDRWQPLMGQLQKQGITDYKIWEGIVNKHYPKLGILQAHKQIIRHAKEQGYKYCHIAEDDITFFGEESGAWEHYLKSLPMGTHAYFGMLYVGSFEEETGRITSQCSGMTLWTCFEPFYDFVLNIPEHNGGKHIDRYITEHCEQYVLKVCQPMVCYQNGLYSDNLRTKTPQDYSPLLKGRNLFGQ